MDTLGIASNLLAPAQTTFQIEQLHPPSLGTFHLHRLSGGVRVN